MKKATAPLVTIIFIAFTIALVLFIIAFVFIPRFTMMIQGKCWADAGTTADQIASDLRNAGINSDQKMITLGDCVGGIIIFNKNQLYDANGNILVNGLASGFSQVIEEKCVNPKDQKAYILVIPWKTLSEEAAKDKGITGKVYTWLTSPIMSFKDAWEWGRQKSLFIQPICKGLDFEVSDPTGSYPYYCIPQGICGNTQLVPKGQFETYEKCDGKVSGVPGCPYFCPGGGGCPYQCLQNQIGTYTCFLVQKGTQELWELKADILNKKTISFCYKPFKNPTTGQYSLQGLAECTK